MPNTPIVNKGQLYVNGLGLEYGSATTLKVFEGAARDSSNVNDIVLPSEVIINTAVVGANGLDTGSAGNNQTWAVYIIGDSTGFQPTAGIMSLAVDGPLLPFGYDMWRRIGWTFTDGSANLKLMYYYGEGQMREAWYATQVQVASSFNTTSFTAIDLSAAVPNLGNDKNTKMYSLVEITPNGAGGEVLFRFPGSGTSGLVAISGDAAGVTSKSVNVLPVHNNSSGVAQIDAEVSNASDNLDMWVIGFTDILS